mgnify:FL=1
MKTHDFTDYIHYLECEVIRERKLAWIYAFLGGLLAGYILSLFI